MAPRPHLVTRFYRRCAELVYRRCAELVYRRCAELVYRRCAELAASRRGLVAVLAVVLLGCGPKIGDKCLVSSDCATNSSRLCDTSQPDGYCTVFNCTNDTCPNNAACVVLQPATPGCPYDDYQTPSRSSRSLCLATCNSDSDCRTAEGYVCTSPLGAPWRALILDNNQGEKVCIVAPTPGTADAGLEDAAVCNPGPNMSLADATSSAGGDGASDGEPLVDVGPLTDGPLASDSEVAESGPLMDAPAEAESLSSDAGVDAALDAGGEAGLDAASDDAGLDATIDAPIDAEPDADAGSADAAGSD
jgi:hypothetical protein